MWGPSWESWYKSKTQDFDKQSFFPLLTTHHASAETSPGPKSLYKYLVLEKKKSLTLLVINLQGNYKELQVKFSKMELKTQEKIETNIEPCFEQLLR